MSATPPGTPSRAGASPTATATHTASQRGGGGEPGGGGEAAAAGGGGVPPLGAMAIAVTVAFLVAVVAYMAFSEGKRRAAAAAAVPLAERDAKARLAFFDAVDAAHARYARDVAAAAPADALVANPLAAARAGGV